MKARKMALVYVLLSFVTLYPRNPAELFYYDDNPIRYMIARMFVEERMTPDDRAFFISYGSAEIYLPFFLLAKKFEISYELVYNLSSLATFVFSSVILYAFGPRSSVFFGFAFPIMMLLGIICVKRGAVHWFFSSSVFLVMMFSEGFSVSRFLLTGIAYLVSPTLLLISLFFSLIFLLSGERKRALFILSPALFLVPKILMIAEMTFRELEDMLTEDLKSRKISESARPTFPADFRAFLRFLAVDYVQGRLFAAPIVYIVVARALIFTRRKADLIPFALLYLVSALSVMLFKMWTMGFDVAEQTSVGLFTIFFVSNPFRHAPLMISYLVVRSDERRVDELLRPTLLALFLLWSATTVIKGRGELPTGIPKEVKDLIEFLKRSDAKEILVEGDTHLFDGFRLIHPLYDSHMISYIVAEVENKSFHGGIIPWYSSRFNFMAGMFNLKPIRESDIMDFIRSRGIDVVLCWTSDCRDFFRNAGEVRRFGVFSVINLKRPGSHGGSGERLQDEGGCDGLGTVHHLKETVKPLGEEDVRIPSALCVSSLNEISQGIGYAIPESKLDGG